MIDDGLGVNCVVVVVCFYLVVVGYFDFCGVGGRYLDCLVFLG